MNNTGTKLDVSKSKYQPKGPKKSEVDFEKEISAHIKNEDLLKKQAAELSERFIAALNDKTLPENKGLIGKDVEIELIKNLSRFAIILNTDEAQPEGIGGVGLCQILMNCVLMLRDKVNELSYKVYQLEQQKLKDKSSSE